MKFECNILYVCAYSVLTARRVLQGAMSRAINIIREMIGHEKGIIAQGQIYQHNYESRAREETAFQIGNCRRTFKFFKLAQITESARLLIPLPETCQGETLKR